MRLGEGLLQLVARLEHGRGWLEQRVGALEGQVVSPAINCFYLYFNFHEFSFQFYLLLFLFLARKNLLLALSFTTFSSAL